MFYKFHTTFSFFTQFLYFFWMHNIPKFKIFSVEVIIEIFHLKDNVQKVTFLFKISLSTLNFSLFCGNINDTALSDIAFPERPYNENDFEFQ